MADFNHIVYFEVFGNKMKMKLTANSEHEAREKVMDYVKYSTKFYKVDKVKEEDPIETLKEIIKDVFDNKK